MTEKRPAIGYVRVSTEEQAAGVSLDMQEAKLRAWADLYDYELVHIYRDAGISGRSLRKRPAAQEAIAHVRRLQCPLVFYSLSRMVRNVREAIQILEDVEAAGGSLASVDRSYNTATVSGWLSYIMEAVMAEIEVRQISERTHHAMQYKKAAGQRVGAIPYGRQLGNGPALELNPEEQNVIERMRTLDGAGHTLTGIAERLNQAGYRTRSGKPFSHVQVRRALGIPAQKRNQKEKEKCQSQNG